MDAQIVRLLEQVATLPAPVLLIVVLVAVIMAACTLARFTTRTPSDNGLRMEGTY